jgi:quercetin dioxygenase-like cupin family protein
MPFVRDGEAMDVPFADLDAVAGEMGPPPWRACLVGTSGMRVLLLHWPPGFATVPHVHPAAEETFQVIRGHALFTIGDEPEREVGPGSFLLALRGVPHSIRVADGGEPLLLLAAVGPNEDRPDETIDLA